MRSNYSMMGLSREEFAAAWAERQAEVPQRHPIHVGNVVRLSFWKPGISVRVTAVGEQFFLGYPTDPWEGTSEHEAKWSKDVSGGVIAGDWVTA